MTIALNALGRTVGPGAVAVAVRPAGVLHAVEHSPLRFSSRVLDHAERGVVLLRRELASMSGERLALVHNRSADGVLHLLDSGSFGREMDDVLVTSGGLGQHVPYVNMQPLEPLSTPLTFTAIRLVPEDAQSLEGASRAVGQPGYGPFSFVLDGEVMARTTFSPAETNRQLVVAEEQLVPLMRYRTLAENNDRIYNGIEPGYVPHLDPERGPPANLEAILELDDRGQLPIAWREWIADPVGRQLTGVSRNVTIDDVRHVHVERALPGQTSDPRAPNMVAAIDGLRARGISVSVAAT